MLGIDKALEQVVQQHGDLLRLAAEFFQHDIKVEKEGEQIKEVKISLLRFSEYARSKNFKLKVALPNDIEFQIYEDEIPTKDGGKVKVKVLEI
jgi:hypothetical protein